MSRPINKIVDYILIPSAGLLAGLSFMKPWPNPEKLNFDNYESKLVEDPGAIERLNSHLSKKYKINDKDSIDYKISKQTELIPKEHSHNHVGINLFRHPERFCIDPVFVRHKNPNDYDGNELSCYFHLGKQFLDDNNSNTYKGALTLIMDEVLCFTGFPKLPNKRGVTASLELEFMDHKIPTDQLLVLNCKITEQKGRKCITTCELSTVEEPVYYNKYNSSRINFLWTLRSYIKSFVVAEKPEDRVLARGKCVLVEPKWFKYVSWIDVFSGDALN